MDKAKNLYMDRFGFIEKNTLGKIYSTPSTVYVCLHFCGLTACGTSVLPPEMNSHPLYWKCWVLTMTAVVQSLSCAQLFATPWTEVHQASLSFTISKFAQTHVHWVRDAIQPSHPLLPPFSSCLQSLPASASVWATREAPTIHILWRNWTSELFYLVFFLFYPSTQRSYWSRSQNC